MASDKERLDQYWDKPLAAVKEWHTHVLEEFQTYTPINDPLKIPITALNSNFKDSTTKIECMYQLVDRIIAAVQRTGETLLQTHEVKSNKLFNTLLKSETRSHYSNIIKSPTEAQCADTKPWDVGWAIVGYKPQYEAEKLLRELLGKAQRPGAHGARGAPGAPGARGAPGQASGPQMCVMFAHVPLNVCIAVACMDGRDIKQANRKQKQFEKAEQFRYGLKKAIKFYMDWSSGLTMGNTDGSVRIQSELGGVVDGKSTPVLERDASLSRVEQVEKERIRLGGTRPGRIDIATLSAECVHAVEVKSANWRSNGRWSAPTIETQMKEQLITMLALCIVGDIAKESPTEPPPRGGKWYDFNRLMGRLNKSTWTMLTYVHPHLRIDVRKNQSVQNIRVGYVVDKKAKPGVVFGENAALDEKYLNSQWWIMKEKDDDEQEWIVYTMRDGLGGKRWDAKDPSMNDSVTGRFSITYKEWETLKLIGDPAGSRAGSPTGSRAGSPVGSRDGSPVGSPVGSPAGSRAGSAFEEERRVRTAATHQHNAFILLERQSEENIAAAHRRTYAHKRIYAGTLQLSPNGPKGLPVTASALNTEVLKVACKASRAYGSLDAPCGRCVKGTAQTNVSVEALIAEDRKLAAFVAKYRKHPPFHDLKTIHSWWVCVPKEQEPPRLTLTGEQVYTIRGLHRFVNRVVLMARKREILLADESEIQESKDADGEESEEADGEESEEADGDSLWKMSSTWSTQEAFISDSGRIGWTTAMLNFGMEICKDAGKRMLGVRG